MTPHSKEEAVRLDHTPGPWQVSKRKARRVTDAHGVTICNAILRNQGGPKHKMCMKAEHEAEANAELIAAAPDLAQALCEAIQLLDDCEISHPLRWETALHNAGYDIVKRESV